MAAAKGQRNKRPNHVKATSKTTQVQRRDNGYKRSTEITDGQGRQYNRDATVTRDREAGSKTRDVLWTGPDGQTATRQDVVTRTDDGYSRSTTHTGPEGNTSERQVISAWDPETKTWTKQVTYDRYDFDQD